MERSGDREAERRRQPAGTKITAVYRSDGVRDTYIFMDYLSKVSPEWKSKVGVAT